MFNIGDQVAYLIDGVREHAEVITTSSLGHVFSALSRDQMAR